MRFPSFSIISKHPIVINVIKTAIGVTLLIALITYINLAELIDSINKANPAVLALGAVMSIANISVQFLRWRYLVRLVNPETTSMEVLNSLLASFATGFFTPAQIGAYGGRVFVLRSMKLSHAVWMSIVDKLYIIAIITISGCISLPLYIYNYFPQYWNPWYGVMAVMIGTAMTIVLVTPSIIRMIVGMLPAAIAEHKIMVSGMQMRDFFRTPQARILFLWTLAYHIVILTGYVVFTAAFEGVNILPAFLSSSNVLFVKSVVLPISIGDLGIRESASVFFFSRIGVSAAAAFNASLCMFITGVLLPSIAGAVVIIHMKIFPKRETQ